jgi:hypothetical protein
MANAKPDHFLYIILPGDAPTDKKTWVRIGAVWQAQKGYSIKPEPLLTLYAPFNVPGIGIAIMPADDEQQNRGNRR